MSIGLVLQKLRIFDHFRKCCRLSPNWDIGAQQEYQFSIAQSWEFSSMLENICHLGPIWVINGAAECPVSVEEIYEFSSMIENFVAAVRTGI